MSVFQNLDCLSLVFCRYTTLLKLQTVLLLFFFQILRFEIGGAAYLWMRLIHGRLRYSRGLPRNWSFCILFKQCAKYASLCPDPEVLFGDAFSAEWNILFSYAFPPFSLIGRCLEKVHANKAEGILIVPLWPSQSWYPKLLRLLVEPAIVILPKRNLLVLPGTRRLHPLQEKLTLLGCLLSGNFMKNEDFLRKQPRVSCCLRGTPLENNMTSTPANGFYSAVQGKLIQCMQI